MSHALTAERVREAATAPRTAAPLGVLTALFDRLHAEDIPYCHWKSNEHLADGLEGRTDLDLLVDRSAAPRFVRVLADAGFKRFVVRPDRWTPGLEDYLGFDAATGRLTHLHVHYQLAVGNKFLKAYRLPWESDVLAGRVLDAEYGVYVADPNMEALLLVVRAALKLRLRDTVLGALRWPYPRGKVLRELRWVATRVHPRELCAVARPLVGERAAALLPAFVAAPRPSLGAVRAFRAAVAPALERYRLYGPVATRLRRWGLEASSAWHLLRGYVVRGGRTSSRTAPQGGLTVGLVGADPAEDAAVARAITRWLATDTATIAVAGAGPRPARAAARARARGRIVIRHRLSGGAPRSARAVPGSPDVVVTVAAGRPREDVMRQIKQVIWNSL